MGGFAWVTLATNDSYSLGALVLAHSLKKANTAHKLVVLITPSVSQPMREQLQTVFDIVKLVEVLDSKDEAHLALLKRPELGITFTKIHCWRLTEFDKCVFLDADTLVVRNCDELFEREELSAAPDFSWPDCFNSGVFVFKPSVETFDKILQFAVEKGSFDGGDQGLLNMFFSDWATEDIKKHLPFTYNLSSLAAYTYIPAFKQYGAETRIVHFIGTGKPWLQKLDPATKIISPTPGAEHLTPMLQRWWDLFCEHVHPHLNKNLDNSNGRPQPEPVEVCSNSVTNEINDDFLKPCNPEPYAPYREKDDYRQFNLPYQPFDVKGTSGELLNIEFLKASAAPSPPPPEIEEEKEEEIEQNQSSEKMEEKKVEEVEEKEEKQEAEIKEEVPREEEKEVEEKQIVEEAPAPKGPFDYDTFFPDENCVNNYLEQNVMTYQPFGHHSHHHKNDHQHQSHHHHQESQNQEQNYQPHQETHNHHHEVHHQETNQHNEHWHKPEEHCNNQNHENQEHHNWQHQRNDFYNDQNNKNDSQHVVHLPRFLTIPENDMRQSGNTIENFAHEKSKCDHSNVIKEPSPPFEEFRRTPPLPPPSHLEDKPPEKPELKKSKSMPQLDVTKIGTTLKPSSVWQSQPNVSTDPKKYLMPKLKPILPRSNSFHKTVPSTFARVTLYTEFLMSSDYKEPLGLPKDKTGFVETQILREALKRSKSEGSLGNKFGPLPYIEEGKKLATPKKRPFHSLDHSDLIDIRECKRQLGNKPKPKEEEKKEEVIQPAVPKQTEVKKKGLFKRIKSRESMLLERRKKKLGKETKKSKENRIPRQESNGQTSSSFKKPTEHTEIFKPSVNGISNNVEDILKKLKSFSKDYIHYFGDIRKKDKPTQSEQNVEKSGLDNENKIESRLAECSTLEEESKLNYINGTGSYINKENRTRTKLKDKVGESKDIPEPKKTEQNDMEEKEEVRELRKPINEPNKNRDGDTQQNRSEIKEVGNNKTKITQTVDKIERTENGSEDIDTKIKLGSSNTIEELDDSEKVREDKEERKKSGKLESSFCVRNGNEENDNISETECIDVRAVKSLEAGKEVGSHLSQSLSIEKLENGGGTDTLEKTQENLVESEGEVEKKKEESKILENGLYKSEQSGVSEKSSENVVNGNVEVSPVKSSETEKVVDSINSFEDNSNQSLSISEKSENGGVTDTLEKILNNSVEEEAERDVEKKKGESEGLEDSLNKSEQTEVSEKSSESSGKISETEKVVESINEESASQSLSIDKSETLEKTEDNLVEEMESGGKVEKREEEESEGLNKLKQSEVSEKPSENVDVSTVQSSETGKVEGINSSKGNASQSLSVGQSENGGFRGTLEKTLENLVGEVESEGKVGEKEEEDGLSRPSEMKNGEVVRKIEESGCVSLETSCKEKVQLGNDGRCQPEPESFRLEVGKVVGSGESVEEEYTQNGEEVV